MNKKSVQDRAKILSMLVEGNSLRAIARMTGFSVITVMKFLVDIGAACSAYQDIHLQNLSCKRIEVDEIWSYVHCKRKNVTEEMGPQVGDVWTWVAICADTKLVPTWLIGLRDLESAKEFIFDLSVRMSERIQLTSDGAKFYPEAVENAYGSEVDYGMLVKMYDYEGTKRQRYIGSHRDKITGNPNIGKTTTAHVERANLNMRMSMRRFTRKTNGFSKKIENHGHAVSIHFMHHNYCRIHQTLRVTPAMAAGVTDRLWDLEDVVMLLENDSATQK